MIYKSYEALEEKYKQTQRVMDDRVRQIDNQNNRMKETDINI